MWFDNWGNIVETIIRAIMGYVGLVIMLRISGKRTLSKMNAFDLIVTVAFGSTLAAVVLTQAVTIAQGLTALGMLILLQWVVAQMSMRFRWFQKLVKSDPRLLVYKGEMLEQALRDERVVPEEVRAAARSNGVLSMDKVHAVVLETDGTFSVISAGDVESTSALKDVHHQRPDKMVDHA